MLLGRFPLSVRIGLLIGFLALALVAIPHSARAQAASVCGPSPAVKAALDQLPKQTPAQNDWEFHEQYQSALQALWKQYPDDVFVQKAYINWNGGSEDRDKVIAEYRARHEQKPDSVPLQYLYGLTLVGRQTPEAITLLNSALEKDSTFAPPRLELVNVYNSRAFLNKEQSEAQLRAFLNACPASLEGYESLSALDDKNLLRPYATPLRNLLATRSDPEAVGAYQTLWAIEFKVQPATEYDALRKQVGQDIERLRRLNMMDKRQWYEALEDGYKLVNDQKQADWAQEQAQTRFPLPYELPAMTKWFKDHHWPDDSAAPAVKHAFYSDLLQQSAEWAKQRPNTLYICEYRLEALEGLDDAAPADVEAAADLVLKVATLNAGPGKPLSPYDYDDLAEALSNKHLQPERVVEWAQKGVAQLEVGAKLPPYDLSSKDDLDNFKYNRDYTRLEMQGFEADGYLQLQQADQAGVLLSQMDEGLQGLKSQVGDIQRHKKSYARRLSAYWGLMAREAELRGRKLDAMGFYENALLTRLDAEEKPEAGKKDELADSARQLWASLGGTDEGWRLWYGRRADALANQSGLTWEDSNVALPAFQLTDLNGKTWTVAALKGKVTFLNFWASW